VNIESLNMPRRGGTYEVLVGNDKIGAEPDAWKYKIRAPYATWSLDFPTRAEAIDAARADIRDNG
jgi:hypothetical protein